MRSRIIALFGTVALCPLTAYAGTITVPGDAPTIQIAINLAADGDEIVVAPGTYFETLDMTGKAITLRSDQGPEKTIIDAIGQLDSAVHCTSGEGPDTVISGFTIRNGSVPGGGFEDRGGGINMSGASPTILDCTFVANDAVYGGAIYANGSSPMIHDCRFVQNTATVGGGAIYLNNCNSLVTGSTFEGNVAVADKGGAIRTNNGSLTVDASAFVANTSAIYGGAISLTGTFGTVSRSSFEGNASGDGGSNGRGGAIYNGSQPSTISECLFLDNTADQFGGGIYAGAPTSVRNCTLVGNAAGGGDGGAYSATSSGAGTLVSLIAWDNGNDPIAGPNTTTWSNVEGGHPGAGNIDAEPMFANLASGDVRLLPGSPCLDAGDTTQLSGEYPIDFDGALRAVNDPDAPDTGKPLLNLAVDMGAFERQVEGAPNTCPGDVDGNGMVDVNDLVQVILNWGVCPN